MPLLDMLEADIAVVQECAKPERESEAAIWLGDNPRQGIAVRAKAPYSVRRLQELEGVPKYVVPIAVSGPVEFNMLVVWSKANQQYRYIEAVVKAARMYSALMSQAPIVLIGDLNSNRIWDNTHPSDLNHTALVDLLKQHDIISAYHVYFDEEHGRETTPTYYFHWNQQRPYHIDYCFIPRKGAPALRGVEVGSYEGWKQHSDHRPLLVDVNQDVV